MEEIIIRCLEALNYCIVIHMVLKNYFNDQHYYIMAYLIPFICNVIFSFKRGMMTDIIVFLNIIYYAIMIKLFYL